jgi:hypothetical protein
MDGKVAVVRGCISIAVVGDGHVEIVSVRSRVGVIGRVIAVQPHQNVRSRKTAVSVDMIFRT